MSRNISASFVGACTAIAMGSAASAQELREDQRAENAAEITSEWRVAINPEDSMIRLQPRMIFENQYDLPSTIRVEREITLNSRSDLRIRFETESGGLRDLADRIRSGGLPFSGQDRETGGSWGMKFKRGASIQYRFRW